MNKCPSCRSEVMEGPVQIFNEPGIEYEFKRYICCDCGIEFWTPLVMPSSTYYEQAGGEYDSFHIESSEVIRWWHKTFIEKFPLINQKGKVLDIGCADGRVLKELQRKGWDVYGIDFDRHSIEVAKKRVGENRAFSYSLEEFIKESEPNSFDLITFFEVLEHQTDPLMFMKNVKKLLKPTGMIAGSVPNTARYIVKKRFSPDNPPHHFTMWRKKQLLSFLTKIGFSNLEIHHTRYEPILLDQIIRSLLLDKIMKEKHQNFDKQKTDDIKILDTNKNSFFKVVKKNVWTPIYNLIGMLEYPFLYLTKKSVSLYFHGKLNKDNK